MDYILIVAVVCLTTIFWWIVFYFILGRNIKQAELKAEASYKNGITDAELVLEKEINLLRNQLEELKSELEISVEPYTTEVKADFALFKKKKIEYGYRYQLFIKGIPCLQPVSVPLNVVEETEVDKNFIFEAVAKAISLPGSAGKFLKMSRKLLEKK